MHSTDEILKNNSCETVYWKTGHSHIKRKVNNEKALAGFEKSGHFFFNKPLGYGYDDGINSAIQVCHLLNNNHKLWYNEAMQDTFFGILYLPGIIKIIESSEKKSIGKYIGPIFTPFKPEKYDLVISK